MILFHFVIQRGLSLNRFSHTVLHGLPKGLSAPNHLQGSSPGYDLPCALYQPHAMGVMELYGEGEEIEVLHHWLHSDNTVSRESPFGHLSAFLYCTLIPQMQVNRTERTSEFYILNCTFGIGLHIKLLSLVRVTGRR